MNDPAAAPSPPSDIEQQFELGRRAQLAGRLDEAITRYRAVLKRAPEHGGALNNLGVALKVLNRFAPAVACYHRALAAKPDDVGLLTNLGNALRGLGRFEEAEAALERALALSPDSVDALNNLSLTRKGARRFHEAIEGLTEVIRRRPDDAEAHLDLALALLQIGELERGFREYEWRWRTKELPSRGFTQPVWDGTPLDGKTILLHAEQGFGDALQFVRYVPLVAARGGRVVLECLGGLEKLMQSVEGLTMIVTKGAALPPFDVQAPLLSLPHLFGTTLATIPAPARYVSAPSDFVQRFRTRLRAPPGMLKIGVVWAGKPSHKNDHNRSAGFAHFVDLLGYGGARWYSLQVGPRAADISAFDCQGLIDDLAPELDDFATTAAAIENLDLVITVDTSVAHLAGALGKPIWLMLAFGGEWRYPEGREDSPWYPSMRLFQQARFGDWDGVFRRVRQALETRRGTGST